MRFTNNFVFAHPVFLNSNNTPTAQGASLTPAQIAKATMEGIPISPQGLSTEQYFEGNTGDSMYIAPQFMRGVDLNDAWNIVQDNKKSFNSLTISENGND
ncbi:hypothetical protein [Capybara microvirus Cap1_SP_61]|nr:hypothetical protein [Capybara microvirus Cap1_SP_61]